MGHKIIIIGIGGLISQEDRLLLESVGLLGEIDKLDKLTLPTVKPLDIPPIITLKDRILFEDKYKPKKGKRKSNRWKPKY